MRTPDSSERGILSHELAVVLPAVLLFILIAFQAGMYWHTRSVVDAAASEAASATASGSDGYAAASEIVSSTGWLSNAHISISGDDETVTAVVTGQTFGVVMNGWEVAATAQAPVERTIAQGDRS